MFSGRDRQILNIAVPSIISNITVPLLGLIDVAVTGHIGDARYIGAIAVGSMMFNVIYWLFGFLRMGTSGMTSQSLGRRDLTDVMRQLIRSLSVALSIALCILILQTPLCRLGLWIIHPEAEIRALVMRYFVICIWGAPAMLSLYALSGWFIGMQNTKIPMIISIMQNVINIAASLFFVFYLDMDIEGVALGTLVAQWGGLLIALLLLFVYYGRLRIYADFRGIFERSEIYRYFSVNRDIFIRTLFLVAVNLFFTSAGAQQGALILAVNTLLMQLFMIYSYIMDGFAYAGEAICGKYYGARNYTAYHDTVRRLFLWGTAMIVVFTLLYYIGGDAFLGLLTSDKSVVSASHEYFPWALAIPLAGMAAFIWDGISIGITATRQMMYSSVISAVLFFGIFFLLKGTLGNHALWLAMILYLFSRGLILTILNTKSCQGAT